MLLLLIGAALVFPIEDRTAGFDEAFRTELLRSGFELERGETAGCFDPGCRAARARAADAGQIVVPVLVPVGADCVLAASVFDRDREAITAYARLRIGCGDATGSAPALAKALAEPPSARLSVKTENGAGDLALDELPTGLRTPVAELPVAPGTHTLEVTDGARRVRSEVEVSAGRAVIVTLDLGAQLGRAAPVEPPPEDDLASAWWLWAALGGAVAIGVGVGVGLALTADPADVILHVRGPALTEAP